MDSREEIRSRIRKTGLGIEIFPVHKPIAPKKEGFRCLSLDTRSKAEIEAATRSSAVSHPDWAQRIEDVDLLGMPGCILDLAISGGYRPEGFDYIISPHNLEHLPDPIGFALQCQALLKPGGMLFITMPDRRACFDYFRPFSSLAELLSAHFEKRVRPTLSQVFEHRSLNSRTIEDGEERTSFLLGTDPSNVIPRENLKEAFADWQEWVANPDTLYRDAHCWTFSPASLELILEDLRFLGVISLRVIEVSGAGDERNEIFAHLSQPGQEATPDADPGPFYENRAALLRKMRSEEGYGA